MTEQTGGLVFESRGLSLGPRLTYARALLAQAAAQTPAGSELAPQRCYFFVEIGNGAPKVRGIDEEDALELDDKSYEILANAAEAGQVDLVLTDTASIDLSFEVPPGLLPEVKQMIEAEIAYRSPFAEGVAIAIWEAHEAPNRGWNVTAALTLEEPVQAVVKKLAVHGATISSVIRETKTGTLRAAPPWVASKADTPASSTMAFFKNLSPALKATLAGATLFALSAAAQWSTTAYQDWSLSSEAAQAQTTLRSTAAAASRLRGLDASIAQSTDVLAITGIMSELLPDGVWLDQIIADGNELTLVGFAPSAADVTRLLSTLPNLKDIKFASPVIRDNSQALERFRIAATLVEEAAP